MRDKNIFLGFNAFMEHITASCIPSTQGCMLLKKYLLSHFINYSNGREGLRNGGGRSEQDSIKFLDLVHFDVLVTLLVGKIPIGNILFLSLFQDIYSLSCFLFVTKKKILKYLDFFLKRVFDGQNS